MAFPELFPATVPQNIPILPHPVTREEVEKAKREQAIAPLKGTLLALSTVPATSMLPAGVSSIAGAKVSQYVFNAFHFQISMEGKAVAPKLGPKGFATYLAPAPIGVVPPELFQLNPSFLHQAIGGNVPGQETAGLKASSVRERVFLSEQAELRIIATVLKDYTYPGTPKDLSAITTAELVRLQQFLHTTATTQARTPAALNAINAELAQRGNNALPAEGTQAPAIPSPQAPPPPGAGPIAPGSNHPYLFKPVNALALAIKKLASGIDLQLVQNFADP